MSPVLLLPRLPAPQVRLRIDEMCKYACRQVLSSKDAIKFKARIKGDYRVFMILDNLPVAMTSTRHDSKGNLYRHYQRGWPVGFSVQQADGDFKYYLNNHLRFTVYFNRDPATDLSRIVGFEVQPLSIRHTYFGAWDNAAPKPLETCNSGKDLFELQDPQPAEEGEVIFTYDITFKSSEIRWALRWDSYLQMQVRRRGWEYLSIYSSRRLFIF